MHWLVFDGNNGVMVIYACRIDGTGMAQLTYHAADDLSPVWSRCGRYIYFISQRGSASATANIWRMPFVY